MTKSRVPRAKDAVESFDYRGLSPEFSRLGKPAQRALLNHRIKTPRDLAKLSQADLLGLHGIGKSSIPVLKKILRAKGLSFKDR